MSSSRAKSNSTKTTKKRDRPVLLLDGDLYLYRAAAAAEQEIDWGDDIWSLMTDLNDAKAIFMSLVEDLQENHCTDHMIVALSDKENFRHEVYSGYKGGRKKARKPVGYVALVQWARANFRTHTEPLLEADDVLGILGTRPDLGESIIVSDDKDLKTIPGRLYRPMTGELLEITKEQADRNFLMQALTGDVTDGYSGCPKVGAKTAEKILAGPKPQWSSVVRAYQKAGLTEADALTQARCARILRHVDWDDKTRTIKLWEPTRDG